MSKTILFLNGPNLNMLGVREPEIYGATTLAEVEKISEAQAAMRGLVIDFRQSNTEGELVSWIQEAIEKFDGIIINPAAYTHTSVAILDALKMVKGPVIELHISNPHTRESFRHKSYVSLAATGIIAGLGVAGYRVAIDAMAELLN
ncbi:MAG: type II 3-dehydroquinate dehydratase [Alphaproteobacteria bacterium]|jgi:3-dehydroquinate dehydratase-2